MKIKYSWSQWNGIMAKKPYHSKPLMNDLKRIIKEKKIVKNDYTMFFDDTIIYLKKTVNNGFSSNCYIDVYRIL